MPNSNWYTQHESSEKARQIHSINFNIVKADDEDNIYNTWDEWHLIPSSRPVVNPPSKKRTTYDIPGGNGVLDESDSLRKFPIYSVREGSWEFYVENYYFSDPIEDPDNLGISRRKISDWESLFTDIMDSIHGLRCKVTLDDDPSWYYYGTVLVNEWKSDKDRSKIVIDYEFEPYKIYWADSDSDWLWDPFNFETDWIYDASEAHMVELDMSVLPVSGDGWVHIENPPEFFGRDPISPKVLVKGTDPNGIFIKLNNPELEIVPDDFDSGAGICMINEGNSYTAYRPAGFTLSTVNRTNKCTIYLKGTQGVVTFSFRIGRF